MSNPCLRLWISTVQIDGALCRSQHCVSRLWRVSVLLAALTGRVNLGTADDYVPPPLMPKTYVSPNRSYGLRVKPSNHWGCSHGEYRVVKNGKLVWHGQRPYTLWEAGITDDGVVCGYAYTYGELGFGDVNDPQGRGEFVIVILDPTGKVRLKKSIPRLRGKTMRPNPVGCGMIVDPTNDRLVIRVDKQEYRRRHEEWWTYRLSSGAAYLPFSPQQAPGEITGLILDTQAVVGTPLTLIHWWRYEQGRLGGRFTLNDFAGNLVWSLELEDDYTIENDSARQSRLSQWIRRHGAILNYREPNRFDLHFVKDAQRVTFSVERNPQKQWTVRELRRVPYALPRNLDTDIAR